MALVVAGLVQLAGAGKTPAAETGTASGKHAEDLTAKFGEFYQPVAVEVEPSIPAYSLPLTPDKVSNWNKAAERLGLQDDALAKLRQNGFVVVSRYGDDIVAPYKDIQKKDIPVFVTTDTLLHLYHVQFDESLKDIEEREFYPQMTRLAQMLVTQLEAAGRLALPAGIVTARQQLNADALHKAHTYAAIGLKCFDPGWEPPASVAKDVATVIAKIEAHEGFWPDPEAAAAEWALFRYAEDFSQYVPRGHYTRSEELKRYFKGMMWFGRMAFILKGDDVYGPNDEPALVSTGDAHLQTLAAAHLTKLLATGKLADGSAAREVWQRVYCVTAFYVGLADDLGMEEYEASVRKVAGASMDLVKLADENAYRALQAEWAKHGPPAIYGGTGAQGTYTGPDPGKQLEALDKSAGFRLMGQRYIPDSHIMGRLVAPTVGPPTGRTDMFTCVMTQDGPYRCFPRGLDVMAVLGSHRAEHWLAKLGDDAYGTGRDVTKDVDLRYDAVLSDLKREFNGLSPGDWNRNIYWSWLYALKPLLQDYGKGYPTFMTTDAWQDKSMNTALASWSQLRHDTILYAKQSYTMTMKMSSGPPPPPPVEGYVEPAAEFYARMLTTTRMTLGGLKAMDVLLPQAIERLEKLDGVIARLLEITKKELANQELTGEDYAYIRNFGKALEGIRVKDPVLQAQADKAGKKEDWNRYRELQAQLAEDKSMKTTIIADVHTDQNSAECLEEGTGKVDMIVACYRQPDGRLVLGAGPVLSYYEFKHPMGDRLTDEKWREMLKGDAPPEPPEWTAGYRCE